MTDLILEIEETPGSDVWVDHRARFTNLIGTPLVSCTPNDSGEAIAGVYSGSISSVAPADSGTVQIQTSSPDNPYRTRAERPAVAVDLDGATVYRNLIGGVDIVFSDDAGFDDTWTFEIRIGVDFGRLREGQTSVARRFRARNDSAVTLSAAKAAIKKRDKRYDTNGTVFERAKNFAASATEKLTAGSVAPYHITVENKTGTGSSITADIKADGDLLNVINLTDESTGTSEDLNVVDFYRVTDGDLEGFTFKLSEAILNTSTANILVFNASFTQTAPDSSGTSGAWGTSDIDLTEMGEATGVITAGGHSEPVWARAVVPIGANLTSNPYPLDVEITAEVDDGAGWDM